jgi:hypothetical protein
VQYKTSQEKPTSYYLPYLYRIGVIKFPEIEIDFDTGIAKCIDPNCFRCNQLNPEVCLKCATGFYLKGQACYFECPEGWIADNIRGTCIVSNQVDSSTLFSKSYTKGSCVNMCGRDKVQDCSCSPKCKETGECCFDYSKVNCDKLVDLANLAGNCGVLSENCELCDKTNKNEDKSVKCSQCRLNFYLYKEKCYDKCPKDTYADENNFLCIDNKRIYFF